jgi:anti-sigma regulatory factor (Ser/Thr protein kinase)
MTMVAPPLVYVTKEYPCTAADVHEARHWVNWVVEPLFGPGDETVFKALVCLAELLVNALQHSDSGKPGGSVKVTTVVDEQRSGIRVEVLDAGSVTAPHVIPESVTGEGGPVKCVREDGRGIRIISRFADEYGEDIHSEGRVTWAFVGVP